MLQWGGKAQWFNHLIVRSVPGLEKSYLNVYSFLSVPIYFNSKRFSCFLWYSGRLSCWLAVLRGEFGWPDLLSCLITELPCKLSPTSLWKRNIWARIIPSCCYTKGAAIAFTVIQLYTTGIKVKLIGQTKEEGSFGRSKRLPDSAVLKEEKKKKTTSYRSFIHKWRLLITRSFSSPLWRLCLNYV